MTSRLDKILFSALVIFLPSQLALHLWPSWSHISGVRVDYLSPTLYFTDFLILPLLATGLKSLPRKPTTLLLLIALINIAFSFSRPLSLTAWIRILELYGLTNFLISRRYLVSLIPSSLSLALIWTSLLAWLQFVHQHSLGGLWYWLGERSFSITTPYIAKISLANFGLYLRPYATFPHPNALAGFLLLGLGLLLFYQKSRLSQAAIIFALFTVPLTFSRTAIYVEIIIIIFFLFRRYSTPIILTLSLPLIIFFTYVGDPNAITERIQLFQKSFYLLTRYPVFGVGLSNFIPAFYTHQLFQPVHNIYLLLISELGIPVFIVIGLKLLTVLKKINSNYQWILWICSLVVIITGLLDHYWLTLHQNKLLLTILISLIIIESSQATTYYEQPKYPK